MRPAYIYPQHDTMWHSTHIYDSRLRLFVYTFHNNSPNKVFDQANHARVNFVGSSLWKLSCIKPVPPCVFLKASIHQRISSGLSEVSPRIVMLIGHTISCPMCGPPMPSPAAPR